MRRFRMVADQPDFLPPGLAGGHERIERGRIGQVATIPPHLAWSDSRIGIREVHGPQGPPELELLVHGHIEERAIVVEAPAAEQSSLVLVVKRVGETESRMVGTIELLPLRTCGESLVRIAVRE